MPVSPHSAFILSYATVSNEEQWYEIKL
jgi:hypothetical protein